MKKAEICWKTVNGALSIGANSKQVRFALESEGIKICEKTLFRAIESEFDMTFSEYREYRMSGTKIKLLQTAIQTALKGNVTMLIFCLKNMCGWSDKIENKIEEKPTKELIEQAKELIASYEKEKDEQPSH